MSDLLITQESSELTVKDCLGAKQMLHWLNRERRLDIAIIIDTELTDCLELLQVDLSSQAIKAIVGDIIDTYKWDSIEDIILCLKNGRKGMYGTNYGKMTMIVFSQWMKQHLTEKSLLRESVNLESDHMHNFKNREEYLESVKAGDKNQKAVKKNRAKEEAPDSR